MQEECKTMAEVSQDHIVSVAKRTRQRRRKAKTITGTVGKQVSGYYHAKPIDWTVFDEPNPDVILNRDEYDA